ncbi:MAG: radical SAM protein [Clostridiales bacterium]|nr:radical SAM protein [Clostridiales bacterium]
MKNKYEIINAHAHIYPSKIAEKATEAIGDFYDIKMEMPAGTTDRLIDIGSKAGVSRYVVHSCATKPHQVRAINNFIKEEIDAHPEFIGFMTLHQDLSEEEIENEVAWCIENGFKGIKLHPDFQRFYIDGDDAKKIYRVLSKLNKTFPILFHIGDDRYEYSKPYRLAKMAKEFPSVTFIAAHFGGYRCWDDVDVYKGLDNVYFDTCSSLMFITTERAKQIIDEFGYERFFFGDDFPMWDAKGELDRFFSIPLTENERKAILSENIKKLLNL